jgi:nucleoside-diphosphate-sugar epimerase
MAAEGGQTRPDYRFVRLHRPLHAQELRAPAMKSSAPSRLATRRRGEFAVDLNDRAGLAAVVQQVQPDVVAHLAAIAFVAHGDVEQIYRVNVVGTRNLLEALAGLAAQAVGRAAGVQRQYLRQCRRRRDRRDVPAAPANDYAVSKLSMEYMARLWQDKLPLIVVRPFNYTGVGQHENFLLPKIVGTSAAGRRHRAGQPARVARLFRRAHGGASYRKLLAAARWATFNICSGHGLFAGRGAGHDGRHRRLQDQRPRQSRFRARQ